MAYAKVHLAAKTLSTPAPNNVVLRLTFVLHDTATGNSSILARSALSRMVAVAGAAREGPAAEGSACSVPFADSSVGVAAACAPLALSSMEILEKLPRERKALQRGHVLCRAVHSVC